VALAIAFPDREGASLDGQLHRALERDPFGLLL
jgi:hypothetical protein